MKKKLIALNAVLALGISSVITIPTAYAESLSDLNQKKESIQEKQSDVKVDISDTENKINKLKKQQSSVEDQLIAISEKLEETTTKINKKNKEIKKTNAEITALQKEIDVLKERIAKRNEILKDRALSFQESGGSIDYLQVLFGAKDFSDLFDRVNAVAMIAEADRGILEEHEKDKKDLVTKQAAVKDKLANLENMKAELEAMKAQQIQQKKQKDALMEKIKEQKEHAEDYKVGLEEEKAESCRTGSCHPTGDWIRRITSSGIGSCRKQAAAEAKGNRYHSSSVKTVPVSSGTFTRPAAGVVTSQMGLRWNKQHAGIDIAASGKVAIVAAADGVVSRSYYSSSYGNVVFISHSIGGQLYTTVYAHMSSRKASSGQVVAKGQLIGYMGNTGHSYGQHLHFEVHQGPWNMAKSNAVNPLNYVSY